MTKGRPKLPYGQGKRYSVGFRITKQMKDQIDQACEWSGRSKAAEIEYRLEKSFWEHPAAEEELLTRFINNIAKDEQIDPDIVRRRLGPWAKVELLK